MEIRHATINDFIELMTFYITMNEVINRKNNLYNEENDFFPSRDMVMSAIENEQQYVGIEDDMIVAALIASQDCDEVYEKVNWQIEAAKEEVRILHAIRVLPEYSGRALGRQLILHVLDELKEKGIKAARLDTLDWSGEALHVYTQLGFVHLDTMEIYYQDIGRPVDFKLLEKIL